MTVKNVLRLPFWRLRMKPRIKRWKDKFGVWYWGAFYPDGRMSRRGWRGPFTKRPFLASQSLRVLVQALRQPLRSGRNST